MIIRFRIGEDPDLDRQTDEAVAKAVAAIFRYLEKRGLTEVSGEEAYSALIRQTAILHLPRIWWGDRGTMRKFIEALDEAAPALGVAVTK